MDQELYPVDLANLQDAFPPGREVPQLLKDFATWCSTREWGSVGCFSLVPEVIENAPFTDGALLWWEFALFMWLGDGSTIGFWYNESSDNPPIVLLDSEGQHAVLAPDLQSFLARIAINPYQDNGPWASFQPDEDVRDQTRALAKWLEKRLDGADLKNLASRSYEGPSIEAFSDAWHKKRNVYWRENSITKNIAALLAAYRPEPQPYDFEQLINSGQLTEDAIRELRETLDRISQMEDFGVAITHLEARIVDTYYSFTVLDRGRKPVAEANDMKPLLLELREHQYRLVPELGYPITIVLNYSSKGDVLPRFEYHYRTELDGKPVSVEAFLKDLKRAPRVAGRIPDWVRAEADAEELKQLAL